MRFNNSTQKPRSQLPRLLRFWLGQPAGQTRSLAPRVWGQSVGPNSSIPYCRCGAPPPHCVQPLGLTLVETFLLHSQGLRVVESPGLGTREPGIVNRFFFFVKLRLHRKKGNLLQTHAPDLPRKNHPVGGGGGEDFQKCYKKLELRSSLDLHPSLRFALVSYTRRTSFFFLFPNSSFQGPTLWPHTLAPHTLAPPPRIDFRRRASFWQVTSSPAKHISLR